MLTVSSKSPSACILLTVEYVKKTQKIEVVEGNANILKIDSNTAFNSVPAICRYLARLAPEAKLYGEGSLERTEVDHWLEFSSRRLACQSEFSDAIAYLDDVLKNATYLVGHSITLADFAIWAALQGSGRANDLPAQVARYYKYLSDLNEFKEVSKRLPKSKAQEMKPKQEGKGERKEEGKFVELPGAEMGKVVVRFPPEASGYLHVGHAKAALLNQYYQEAFKGKLIMRFDDTNPAKETAEFERVILEDIKLLGLKPDMFTHTSDHFELMIELCEKMIKAGKAYVDDTDGETMKAEREQRAESKNRNNTVEENLKKWSGMIQGTDYGQTCCVRAKIDMSSNNGCMRDPTIYRCKTEPHLKTGDKYKVYPTYDFACPIVDSIEGVTHALRTTEYHDRDDQYYWFIDALGMRKPHLYEYSRLNLQNTVMSKRKLTWFVNEGIVEGWSDPRFPTVRGVRRRGMTVEGLKQFIIAQGSSKSVNMMDWDKIWAFNKKVIDPVVPRYTALLKEGLVTVHVKGIKEESQQAQKHPKDASVGMKTVWYNDTVMVESADAEAFKVGENVTFINWGNITISSIKRDSSGKIESVEATPDLENKDYKKTQKITWLAKTDKAPFIPAICVHFDNIISKAVLAKEDDFKDFVNYDSKRELMMEGDPELSTLKKGDTIQLQRRGFYICDSAYEPVSRHSGRESPCILFNIPDGHTKEMPTTGAKPSAGSKNLSAKEKAQNKKGKAAEKSPQEETAPSSLAGGDVVALYKSVEDQGNLIRQLKSAKTAKDKLDPEIKKLLALKAEYKTASGKDWKPGQAPVAVAAKAADPADLDQKIVVQGNKIRDLKSSKAPKDQLDPEIKTLLALKADYKSATGKDWKPGQHTSVTPAQKVAENKMADTDALAEELKSKCEIQGNAVRDLKSKKADKAEIDAAVKQLLDLKAQYKDLTGQDLQGAGAKGGKKGNQQQKQQQQKQQKQEAKGQADGEGREVKKITRLGLEAKKEENLPDWYSQVITKAEMIEYYDVSGCYVLRPWSYGIWESISSWFDKKIKEIGFQNCYFPIFVSGNALETEKEHIEDFAPEVAWVTRSGQSELAEPIAIRPTSETVMYPAYAKWVQSHRDLPIKLNQWCNVVRWEFKHPQPFLRTREFLWQEGHSAYATYEEAEHEVYHIINLYEEIYEELLAIPVVKGRKTDKEKFAGGDFTTTVEAFISATGRGIQAATSHHLGQNFSKMFDISFEDPKTKERGYAYQNSWAITTRSIGVIVMVHGDNKGLVLPPRIAVHQVVIVPCGITANLSEDKRSELQTKCEELEGMLKKAGVRVKGDYRDNYSPGWKFNHWELKGVPLRLELGPKDVEKRQFIVVRRDTGEKMTLSWDNAAETVKDILEKIHQSMYAKAKTEQQENMELVHDFDAFCNALDQKKMLLAPFCGGIPCEEKIKKDSARDSVQEEGAPAMGAKGLCIPFKQPQDIPKDAKCICPGCDCKPKYYTLFGRSY